MSSKVLKRNEDIYGRWSEMFGQYLQMNYRAHELNNEEKEKIFFQTNKLLSEISDIFIAHGRFRDRLDNSTCSIHIFGQQLFLKSEKMGITFNWGLEHGSFYLESSIENGEQLQHMTDLFWAQLLQLKELGEFHLFNTDHLQSEEKPYYGNRTSAVFRIIRQFMRWQTRKLWGNDHQQPSCMEIGQWRISWNMEHINWPTLAANAPRAFKLMYGLNYQLWRRAELNKKKSFHHCK